MLIVRSAFGLDQAAAGAFGGLSAALLNGAKRGLFSNEAGMGSAPNMAATATTIHPATQGLHPGAGSLRRYHRDLLGHGLHHPAVRPVRPDGSHRDGGRQPDPVGDRVGVRRCGRPVHDGGDLPLRLLLDHRQLRLCRRQHDLPGCAGEGAERLPHRRGAGGLRRLGGRVADGLGDGRRRHGPDGAGQLRRHPDAVEMGDGRPCRLRGRRAQGPAAFRGQWQPAHAGSLPTEVW